MKRFSCIKIAQGKFKMVSFVISAKDLFELVSINRRIEDKRTGYQRALNPKRVAGIAKFVDAGNALPTNVVIALDTNKIRLPANANHIDIDEGGDAGWVIDGQHRLAGASEADADIELPVTAFIGLDTTQQIQQFITINKEAQRVATSLYLDLLPDLVDPKRSDAEKAKERAVDISLAMRSDEEGPFFNRIVSLKPPSKGQLSLTNFVRKVAPLVQRNGGLLRNHPIEVQRGMIDNYFAALGHVFPKEYSKSDPIFFKTIGFGAFLNALHIVHDTTLARTRDSFSKVDIVETLKPIQGLSFEDFAKAGTGNQAENLMGKHISDMIVDATDGGAQTPTIRL